MLAPVNHFSLAFCHNSFFLCQKTRKPLSLPLLMIWIVQATHPIMMFYSGNPQWRGRLSTVVLLVQSSLDELLLILPTLFTRYKTSYLNEEVNRTKPSPSVSVPCFIEPWRSLRIIVRNPLLFQTNLLNFFPGKRRSHNTGTKKQL
jgi:hypothetical protein